MRMKAALASSLAYRPRLLVLDEPFSGLDPVVREDLIEGIIESAEETTILVSSHDLAEIESFASHIAYLDSGRLRFAEEMTSLSARFREIEVTSSAGPDARALANGRQTGCVPIPTRCSSALSKVLRPRRTSREVRRLFGRSPQRLGEPDVVAGHLSDPGAYP